MKVKVSSVITKSIKIEFTGNSAVATELLSVLIGAIKVYHQLNTYFSQLTTICILRHKDYDLQWPNTVNYNVLLLINPVTLEESFAKDIHNYSQQDERFASNGVYYDDFTRKFVAAIQISFCEGFVVFQDDIPKFAAAFRKASLYSKWRSMYNYFLFIYSETDKKEEYFEDIFFKNNVNILVVQAANKNSSQFSFKTTKFVGSIFDKPQQLILLTTFNALEAEFKPFVNLYPTDKLQDLQGREIIVGAFDYRPFVAVDFERLPQYYDYSKDNPRHLAHVDGTEMHLVHTFCSIYNCTVQVDTSANGDWGMLFPNFTGNGLFGMTIDGKTHMALGALFYWDLAHEVMDETTFNGRSGITCLVPAPRRVTSWALPLSPFQFSLWLAVIGCLVLEAIALQLTRHFEQAYVQHLHNSSWWSSTQFGLYTTLKLFVSQGTNYVVYSYTVTMVLVACYMIDIIITSIYGGGLAAILTIPKLDEAADSFQRFYKHNITWTATSEAWTVPIMPQEGEEPDPILKRITANFRVFSTEDARKMATTDYIGFAVERLMFGHFGNGDFITPAALTHLKLMVDDIYYVFTVSIVPRLWPHLPKYNDMILHWHSSGFDKFWEWKIAADYMNANEQNQVEASKYTSFDMGPVKLDMNNFAGLILLWLIGIFASIVVFAAEWLVNWWTTNN